MRLRWPITREERQFAPLSVDAWMQEWMAYQGNAYGPLGQQQQQFLYTLKRQEPPDQFAATAQGWYRQNGVVFACANARMMLFSDARFQFRQVRNGRPGDLFGTAALELLETPWPNGTTGDLLARAIQNADLTGNFYAIKAGDTLHLPNPAWVSIVLGSQMDVAKPADAYDATVIGYLYQPGGPRSQKPPIMLPVGQVAHWAPIPDPQYRYRGMSWLTPVVRETMADQAMTDHRLQFFENAATPQMAVKTAPEVTQESFDRFRQRWKEELEGVGNAYRTVFLTPGADLTVIGKDLRQVDFKLVQGAGETRIAAAAGVPPIIVGLSEGLLPRPRTPTMHSRCAVLTTSRWRRCGGRSRRRYSRSSRCRPAPSCGTTRNTSPRSPTTPATAPRSRSCRRRRCTP